MNLLLCIFSRCGFVTCSVDTYMALLNEGLDASYRDTMYRSGLRDVVDSRDLESLAGDVRRLHGCLLYTSRCV